MELPPEKNWETLFVHYFAQSNADETNPSHDDASHDLSHFRRVYQTAKEIASHEPDQTDPMVIIAAAYLHDIVNLPKNHPENFMSSRYAAAKAKEVLHEMDFPKEKIAPVCHAIEAHSFSAKLTPETLEAKIIQDADRMEALGALGILRTFYVSGRIGRAPYDHVDLHAKNRPLDDRSFGLDHFYCKLFKLPSLLQTAGGRQIAEKRTAFLHFYVKELEKDLLEGKGGAMALSWTCHRAGEKHQKLFDLSDPFAKKRPLAPSLYVVDHLTATKEEFPDFNSRFLLQLEDEMIAGILA